MLKLMESDLEYLSEDGAYTLEDERRRQIEKTFDEIKDQGQPRNEIIEEFNDKIEYARKLIISLERNRKNLIEENEVSEENKNEQRIILEFQKSLLYILISSAIAAYGVLGSVSALSLLGAGMIVTSIFHSIDLSRRIRYG